MAIAFNNYYEIISRDIRQKSASSGSGQTGEKENILLKSVKNISVPTPVSSPQKAWPVSAGKNKKLVRCLEITEEIVLPIGLLIFSVIYWTYAMIVYFG